MSSDIPSRAPLVGRTGPLSIAIGVVTVIIGILVLAWPTKTLMIIAVFFGIELIILGIGRIAVAFTVVMPKNLKIVGIVLGALTVLAGIFCFLRPGASLLVVAIFFAAGFIVDGIGAIARVQTAQRSRRQRTIVIASGILSIVAGLIVLIFPGASLVLLARVAGIVLIVLGVVQLATAIASRRSATDSPVVG